VLIAKVDPAGPAAEKGIRAGFVIMEVNQEEVHKPGDAKKAVAAARKKGRKSVLLLLADGSGDLRFVAVRIDK
jgi:serine protease Do